LAVFTYIHINIAILSLGQVPTIVRIDSGFSRGQIFIFIA